MSDFIAVADLQHSLRGVQGGDQEWGTLCPGKTGRTDPQIVICRTRFYKPNFLHLLISRKELKSLTVNLLFMTSSNLLVTSGKFLPKCVSDCSSPSSSKSHIYWPPHYLHGAVLSERLICLPGYSPHSASDNTKLITLTLCKFFQLIMETVLLKKNRIFSLFKEKIQN